MTTGTGSGKTECFLFPILDHCPRARRSGQRGIKAVILYPMNALAADQEKRFARVIWKTPELRAAGIRVGNYTGRYDPADPGAAAGSGTMAMGKDHGISNHQAQQENPPDILLTNYKMLDYLLLRPQDQRLWRHNSGQETAEEGQGGSWSQPLRYLVLDELHTYDGAQGADVACLIRRLKERLEIAKGALCVVGTSATLDDRESPGDRTAKTVGGSVDAKETGSDRLARFASTLFEEEIDAEAVIGEDRLTVEEMIDANPRDVTLPNPIGCQPLDDEDALTYAMRQSRLWGGPRYGGPEIPDHLFSKEEQALSAEEKGVLDAVEAWSVELGTWLKGRLLFQYLLGICDKAEHGSDGPLTLNDLVKRLAREELSFNDYPREADRSAICASFFALVAQAKEIRSGHAFPLVPTQVQLWIRELRRLGRLVYDKPVFSWLDEPTQDYPSLPVFHCSECDESGWVALHDPSTEAQIGAWGVRGFQLDSDPSRIYRGWFGYQGTRNPHIVVISPWQETAPAEGGAETGLRDPPTSGGESEPASKRQLEFGFTQWYLCPKSLVLRLEDGPCPLTGDPKRFRVRVNRETRQDKRQNRVGDQGCPNCGSKEGVFFIGSQSATSIGGSSRQSSVSAAFCMTCRHRFGS